LYASYSAAIAAVDSNISKVDTRNRPLGAEINAARFFYMDKFIMLVREEEFEICSLLSDGFTVYMNWPLYSLIKASLFLLSFVHNSCFQLILCDRRFDSVTCAYRESDCYPLLLASRIYDCTAPVNISSSTSILP
jgi:hypothetical protein